MQLGKIYTRGGDEGMTHLVTGQRVSKSHYLMELTGSFDELNCFLGSLRTGFVEHENFELFNSRLGGVLELLPKLQNALFDIGSLLACDPNKIPPSLPEVNSALIELLEYQIDKMNEELEPLPSFVLPGGSELNARAHLARSFCRRVERQFVHCLEDLDKRQKEKALPLLNRLSDWLFTLSRAVSKIENKPEFLWEHPIKKTEAEK